ncbi:MAG: hypothetical protein ACUZ9M_00775 [Candidatus Scalindua sp.]
MKERPILFNTAMVKALLDGRKTQTRRIIKPQPAIEENGNWKWPHKAKGILRYGSEIGYMKKQLPECAKYQVGDRLYVKEEIFVHCGGLGKEFGTQFGYINNPEKELRTVYVSYEYSHSYRPASRMPKYAVRIWLEVAGVRVERIQDISKADVKAEGIEIYRTPAYMVRRRFKALWESCYKGSWERNDWVWVYEFKRDG